MVNTGVRMVAIFRADLPVPAGKMVAQADRVFLLAWRLSHAHAPFTAVAHAEAGRAKVVLRAVNFTALERVAARAFSRGTLPTVIANATCTALAEPAVTALGAGPILKTDCSALTRCLQLM